MALTVTDLKRSFVFNNSKGNKIMLKDPGMGMSVNEVVKFYAGTYPELATATIKGPKIEGDKQIFTISSSQGTKG